MVLTSGIVNSNITIVFTVSLAELNADLCCAAVLPLSL